MLGLYNFNALPIAERGNALWEHGTFIVASDHPGDASAADPPAAVAGRAQSVGR
jgi:hypothetical protein